MTRPEVTIELNRAGFGSVHVGDVDLSNIVMGVSLESTPGHGVQAVLRISPHKVIVRDPKVAVALQELLDAQDEPAGHDEAEGPESTLRLMIRNGDPEIATLIRKMIRNGEITLSPGGAL